MVVFVLSGRIRANWLFSVKVAVFGQIWLYTSRVVVCEQSASIRAKSILFGQSCCNRQSSCILAKVVVFGQKRLYSGKSGCFWAKDVLFWQKWLYSG